MKFFVLPLFVILIQPLFATDYYVSKKGDNAADGSPAAPWRDIQYGVDRLKPGDVLRVREGSYNEAVLISVSGTESKRITITADEGHHPVVDGKGLHRGYDKGNDILAGFVLISQSDITINGFEIVNFEGIKGCFPSGIWVRGSAKRITISNNKVHDIRAKEGGGAHGIACYGTKVDPMEGIHLDANEVYDCYLQWSEAVVINGNVRGFLVSNNHVHDVDNIAYDFIGYEKECRDCKGSGLDADDIDRARQGIVIDNIAENIDSAGNSRYKKERSAGGIYVDGGADILIERNTIKRANIGIELASEHDALKTENITVRNNLIYDCHVTGIATGGYKGSPSSKPGAPNGKGFAENCVIINNTLYKNTDARSWANAELLLQSRNVNNVYKNNIIFSDGSKKHVRTIGIDGKNTNTGNVFDNNIHYSTDASGRPVAVDVKEMGPLSVEQDPLLLDVGGEDFSIATASPARDRGVSEGLDLGTCDIKGRERVLNVVDIGAYEFGAPVCRK